MSNGRRPYTVLADGLRYELAHPRPVSIETVAYHLAGIPRYCGGQRPGMNYTVAAHSCLVHDVLRASGYPLSIQLAGLLHDAHEAITGDTSGPWLASMPRALRAAWESYDTETARRFLRDALGIEDRVVEHAVSRDGPVKTIDRLVCRWEIPRVLEPAPDGSPHVPDAPDWESAFNLELDHDRWSHSMAQREFLVRSLDVTERIAQNGGRQ